MIDTDLPTAPSTSPLARGFAACLASVIEVPVADLPLPAGDLPQALGAWRSLLAARGFGLVSIADPASFQWAGWWIAVVQTAGADPSGAAQMDPPGVATLAFGTPPGIVLSPQSPGLLGHATAELPITAAYAVASLDPVLRAATATAAPDLHGTVEGLAVAPAAEAEMRLIEVASARAGRGLDGDRYAAGAGTFSPRAGHRPGYDLTLMAAEVLDELATAGHAIDFAATRRNVLTRGIDVNALVAVTFRIGDVLCAGRRLCEPCVHLDRLSGPGLLRPLIHKGGLRVDVLTDGEIRLGAPIQPA
ncbi:MOSC domain-containing protein [Modestobacter sp. I12A-02662]|uniref:MOSC domain-containing protein n=1 Tax=Modestobacter sp. I12A-02662 TaxID=1730496 RepID=UPI0034DEB978